MNRFSQLLGTSHNNMLFKNHFIFKSAGQHAAALAFVQARSYSFVTYESLQLGVDIYVRARYS